ncbi:MAG: DUF4102 domain-containing protein [Methyloglobulus sp.]|nr:DUF4102 domain-containing protein [Methyloglobulus sp.]
MYLRVSPNLTKTWAFYYKKEDKRTEMGLGSINDMSLMQARDKAESLRKQIKSGISPLIEKQRGVGRFSFGYFSLSAQRKVSRPWVREPALK